MTEARICLVGALVRAPLRAAVVGAAGRGRSPLRPRRGRAARCVMDSPNAMRRAQWRAVAAVVGARSRLRPLVYGAAGASAAVDAGRCVYRTQAHAASTSESFWVYLQVVVGHLCTYLEVNPQGLRYTQIGFVLAVLALAPFAAACRWQSAGTMAKRKATSDGKVARCAFIFAHGVFL